MITAIHVRNTRNQFSSFQRQNLLSRLIDFFPNSNWTDDIFIDLPIIALKGIGSQIADNALEYELWLNAIAACLNQRKNYKWIGWKNNIRKLVGIVNATMVPFLSKKTLSNSTQMLLIKKIKSIIYLLEEWIISELVVYENYTIQSTLFSIHTYMFSSNVPLSIENTSMEYNDTILKTTFSLPLIFARTGFMSQNITTNSSSPYRYAISTIIYSRDYLLNDNTTNLISISQSLANVSLFYYAPSSLIQNRWPQNQTIANCKFKPSITFYDAQSPLNISESYCVCPENTSCISRIMFNTTGVLCEFYTTGMIFASVNFIAPIIKILFGNIPILVLYIALITAIFYCFIVLSFWLDNKELKMLEGISNYSGEKEIREHIMHQYIAEEKSKFTCLNFVMFMMKFYHPLVSIYYKLNPIIPRANRAILQLLICHIGSTLLLISYQTNSIFKYSSDWNNLLNWVLLSILLLPFQIFVEAAYDFLMTKSYTKRSYFTKQIENSELDCASKNELENEHQEKSIVISESPEANKCCSPDKLALSPTPDEKKEMENPEIVEETPPPFEKVEAKEKELSVIPEVCETFGVSNQPKEEVISGECEVENDPKEDIKIGVNSFMISASKLSVVIEYDNSDSQQGANNKSPIPAEEKKDETARGKSNEKVDSLNIDKPLDKKNITETSIKKEVKEDSAIIPKIDEEEKAKITPIKENNDVINQNADSLKKVEEERISLGVKKNAEEENKEVIKNGQNQDINNSPKNEDKEEDIVIIEQKEDQLNNKAGSQRYNEEVQPKKHKKKGKHKKKTKNPDHHHHKKHKESKLKEQEDNTHQKNVEEDNSLCNKNSILSSIIIQPDVEKEKSKEELKSNIIIKSVEEIKIEEVIEPSVELKQESKIIHRFNTESLTNTNIEGEKASPYWKTEEVINCNLTSYHQVDPVYAVDDLPNEEISITLPIIKRPISYSFFRSFLSPLFFILIMASSFYYNGTTIIIAETDVIITWIISSLIIGLLVFLLWNSLWVIMVSIMGYYYKKSSSDKLKAFLFIILPSTACEIATEYACKI